jgi:hypothetical protein
VIYRYLKLKILIPLALVTAVIQMWQVRLEALTSRHVSQIYRDFFQRITHDEAEELAVLEARTRLRALRYEDLIRSSSTFQGMVITREHNGRIGDLCDSLLFSSLRYVSLRKLGLDNEAAEAWDWIVRSRNGGKWFRHPGCAGKSTSRDMIVGLLAALTQRPEGYRDILQELITYVGENSGYVGDGPFYVSYLSPGLAEVLRHFARIEGIEEHTLPSVVRYGFSTMEFDTYLSRVGFESHLISMVLWIEMELNRLEPPAIRIRGIPMPLDRLSRALWGVKVFQERWAWQAQRLVDRDPPNLFFRWLRLKTADALSAKARLTMLRELDAMHQFPEYELPQNCTRKADYLWQRASREYQPLNNARCTRRFSGVDYLWMASVLTAPEYRRAEETQTALSH